ncbi:hypothetical protein CkaCkLH20_12250 [Colletotrichum karsti]|uniref:Uncharacterized protein n=1 Tax=Colletotrichum karsti TaxID=1095194 RepID=A0A9P6LEN5_9PEZI|nr:uncharacterized protein CkaCkLH20_12250 [Colletotrichum karsti]KAF9870286.1 hypothetical protein CkaCkLH20_12250 [Colletotrichum karsti]
MVKAEMFYQCPVAECRSAVMANCGPLCVTHKRDETFGKLLLIDHTKIGIPWVGQSRREGKSSTKEDNEDAEDLDMLNQAIPSAKENTPVARKDTSKLPMACSIKECNNPVVTSTQTRCVDHLPKNRGIQYGVPLTSRQAAKIAYVIVTALQQFNMSGTQPMDSAAPDGMPIDQISPAAPDMAQNDHIIPAAPDIAENNHDISAFPDSMQNDQAVLDRRRRLMDINTELFIVADNAQDAESATTCSLLLEIMDRASKLSAWVVWNDSAQETLDENIKEHGGGLTLERVQSLAEGMETDGETYEETIQRHLTTLEEALEAVEKRLARESTASDQDQPQVEDDTEALESLWKRLEAIDLVM